MCGKLTCLLACQQNDDTKGVKMSVQIIRTQQIAETLYLENKVCHLHLRRATVRAAEGEHRMYENVRMFCINITDRQDFVPQMQGGSKVVVPRFFASLLSTGAVPAQTAIGVRQC